MTLDVQDPLKPRRWSERIAAVLGGGARLAMAIVLSAAVVPPVALGVAGYTLLNAPLPGELPDRRPTVLAEPSTVYDREGNEIGVYRGFDRSIEVSPEDIPQVVKDAVVAIEDRRFWEHNGVDLEGVARAARINLELGEIAQGGSTITQQYIKNAYLSGERTFERKFREAILATDLEQQLSKEEILFGYLESVYFGSGAYGIGAAAEVYFGKPVNEIDLSEAAVLAAVIQAPTRLSPRVDREGAEERRLLVLQALLDEEKITLEDFEEAAEREIWLVGVEEQPSATVTAVVEPPANGASAYPFFVDWVEQQLIEELGPDLVQRGGLTIETSIDPTLQAEAESVVAQRLQNTEYPVDMSMVSLDPQNGQVLVMVGGRDYDASQVNLALGGSTGFQPGSSFKPIVLAEAFELGIGPETIYPAPATWSVPGCAGDQCTVSNYDNADRGEISLRAAMQASVNTVFVELITDVSIAATAALANDLGISRVTADGPYGPSLALGSAETSPLEMASAYGTFANSGVRVEPVAVLRVLDREGRVLINNTGAVGERVLSAAAADNVTSVLADVVSDGTGGRAAVSGHPIAGKTGTTQNYWAGWFVGYTPSLATAVWMGHADGLASLYNVNGVARVTGGSHPAIAFGQFMSFALAGTEPEAFPVPAELEQAVERFEEVVARSQEETVAGPSRALVPVPADCDGACEYDAVPTPALTPPAATTTIPSTTTSSSSTTSSTTTPAPGQEP